MAVLKLSIGNICKEVQRIKEDIENGDIHAVERCDNLDSTLCSIEEGNIILIIEEDMITVEEDSVKRI